MKKVKKINEAAEHANSIKTSDLWVVRTHRGMDPYYIFIKKEDAEVEKERYSKEYYDYYRKVNHRMTDEEFEEHFKPVMENIKVVTLDNAIDEKVDEAVDNATIHDESY